MNCIRISPLDPFLARDGRPYPLGGNIRTLSWPYPSVTAGGLRTLCAKVAGMSFQDPDTPCLLRKLATHGPLLVHGDELYFPSPADAVWEAENDSSQMYEARPQAMESGKQNCTLPMPGIDPVFLVANARMRKPEEPPPFWSSMRMAEWLTESQEFVPPSPKKPGCNGYLESLAVDRRTHVGIDRETQAPKEEILFSTAALAMPHSVEIAVATGTEGDQGLEEAVTHLAHYHPLGGERRLAFWQTDGKAHSTMWGCPRPVAEALRRNIRIRMVLATPALFKGGWKPGWLGDDGMGTVPGSALRVRLRGASLERWKPVSGYSLAPPVGPKAVRWLVPAGTVYFFDVLDGGDAACLAGHWLQPVCDTPQDGKDGFGLALWGIWSAQGEGR